ncbi:hypothetical protein FOZ60_013795 [Perkinsus olseni]|uniref:Uncharacterized protein n=1 Tax=Perkinsus olseni TaxID=32597 RepID=A0A7J6P823_PEROL|nr:hypothetical protein FOZ60_013795 [Perkinsus olseni]
MLSSAAAVVAATSQGGLSAGNDSDLLLGGGSHKRRRINIESDSEDDDSDSDDDKPIGSTALISPAASPPPAGENISGVTTPTPPAKALTKDESATPKATKALDQTPIVKSPENTPAVARTSTSSSSPDQTTSPDEDASSEDSDQPIIRRRKRTAQRKVLKYTEDEDSDEDDDEDDASDEQDDDSDAQVEDENDDDEEDDDDEDYGSSRGASSTPARSTKGRRRARPKSESVKSEERAKKKSRADKKVKRESSVATPVSKKKINRSEKEQLVSEVLCRWWYAMPPWPPANFDYEKELARQGFRVVGLQDWEEEDDIDQEGRGKVYPLAQFPGVYRAYDRRMIDVRPNEGKPSFNNLMSLTTEKLKALLKEAIKNQLAELRAQPTFKRPGNGDEELEKDLVLRGKRLGLKDGK